jgi:hypothetical protein
MKFLMLQLLIDIIGDNPLNTLLAILYIVDDAIFWAKQKHSQNLYGAKPQKSTGDGFFRIFRLISAGTMIIGELN